MKPKVLVGITGGIAAYKTADIVSKLVQAGCDVRVVMTPSATRFIAPLTFAALTQKAVLTTLLPDDPTEEKENIFPHLYPATESDLILIAPATANTIAKLAHGLGDNVVTCSALSLSKNALRFFCPAMNKQMWEQPIVQENVEKLKQLHWKQIGPAAGNLACGTAGTGRMTNPTDVVQTLLQALQVK